MANAPDYLKHLLGLIDETWLGQPLPGWPEGWSYYADQRAGLQQSLAITAGQAQRSVGGTSIAQHVRHLADGSRIFAGWVCGQESPLSWDDSWKLDELDAEGWAALRADLDSALTVLRNTVELHSAASDMALQSAFGGVAHLVYHLAAIRQKLLLGRA